MGEANYHLDNNMIFLIGTRDHFAKRRHIRVYSNLNLYYTTKDRRAYVSPDGMVVEPLVLEDDVGVVFGVRVLVQVASSMPCHTGRKVQNDNIAKCLTDSHRVTSHAFLVEP